MSDAAPTRDTPVPVARARRWWLASRSLAVGAALSGVLVGMAAVSVVWTPYDPPIDIRNRLAPPSDGSTGWAPTKFGRDLLLNPWRAAEPEPGSSWWRC